jgi:hypothetical protein
LWVIRLEVNAQPIGNEKKINIIAANKTLITRNDEVIEISLKNLKSKYPDFNANAFYVEESGNEIPSQLENENDTNIPTNLLFLTSFNPNEKKEFNIVYKITGSEKHEYTKRTQAVLGIKKDFIIVNGYYTSGKFVDINSVTVPKDHFAHDALFRIEGPGWESDKIIYRYYLDSRNRTDIYGKKVNELVLQKLGVNDLVSDSKESYSKMLDWGMDIFKVGNSLGIGSIAAWKKTNFPVDKGQVQTISTVDKQKCYICNNGPLESGVFTKYLGWKVDNSIFNLSSNFDITAGSRLTKVSLLLKRVNGDNIELCTGLAKHEGCEFIKSTANSEKWGYIGLYGKQSLSGDNLGTAIFYKQDNLVKITEDSLSKIVRLNTSKGKLTYYFGAAWESEPNGIKNQNEFEQYLKSEAVKLSNPIDIRFESKIKKREKRVIGLDYYFNNERIKDKDGVEKRYHYVWEDTANSGYSQLGSIITGLNVKLSELIGPPVRENLDSINIYIIVDPDTPQENPLPNYIDDSCIVNIVNWVKQGGVLVLFANDKGNCEFLHLNRLAGKFGIHFNEDSRNRVTGNNFNMGEFNQFPVHPIFSGVKQIYMKEISTLMIQKPAEAILSDKGDIIMASAKFGKGLVFAVGDPWLYNEYIDNRILPDDFENYKAAKNLFEWLLSKAKSINLR